MQNYKYDILNTTLYDFTQTQVLEVATQDFLRIMLYDNGNISKAMNCNFMGEYYNYFQNGWCGYVYPSMSVNMLMLFLLFFFLLAMSITGVAAAYRYSKIQKLEDDYNKIKDEEPIN